MLPSGLGWQQLSGTSIQSACPADDPHGMYSDNTMTSTTWYYFAQSCKYWFDAWSGAAVDDVHQQLILFGGGHDDSENDMVLTLVLSGTPHWNLFRAPTVPVPFPDSQNWEGLAPYFVRAADGGKYLPGGTPSSRHTYGSLQYVPSQNKMFSFGGSVEHGGFASTELWALDMATGAWTLASPFSQVPGGMPTTAYNSINGHIVMTDNNLHLYDFDPATGKYTQLSSSADLGNTYRSSAAIDPVHNLFVVVSTTGGTAPAYDYFPGTASTQVVRAFDLSGADKYKTHVWDDPSCNLINAYSGLQWDSALGLLVGYPGGGNKVFFLNSGPSLISTSYGDVPSHKCLTVTIGSQQGIDYPQDPEMTNGAFFTGINQRFAYFPSLDAFVLANRVSGGANAWILRLNNANTPNFSVMASPSTLTVIQGNQGSSTITTSVSGGFNNAISLSATGGPSGATVTLNPTAIPAPGAGTSAMTVSVAADTPPGTYPITVKASGGGIQQATTVSLTVTSGQQSLTVKANPATLSLTQGTQGSSTITTSIGGTFNSSVGLSAAGTPQGTTISFNPTTIPAPGAGTSGMTVSVGANTAPGVYPITVTASGGGLAPTTTVNLTVLAAGGFQQGFNFRSSAGYVSDPSGTTHVLASTAYPTTVGGVTFGWVSGVVQARDRSTSVDPRLAGINFVNNGSQARFQVDLPAPGTYVVSLAMGDNGYGQCASRCQVQFLDGNTDLGAAYGASLSAGYFFDDANNKWPAATWPSKNITKQITMAGTHLTVVVGTTTYSGDVTPVAFLGITQGVGNNSDFAVTASPSSLTVAQGKQGTSTITTSLTGSFNNAINLSASGAPSGTTVSFNPTTIPAPGAGSSVMTVAVGVNTAPGTYPITVTATGNGIQHTTTVTLTVGTVMGFQQGFNFRASAGYVSDPSNTTHVLANTAYPTKAGSVTFGWLNVAAVQSRDRSKTVDPRLAGVNYVSNGTPGRFQVDLPGPGNYMVSLALGDAGYGQCWTRCQVQLLDGNTVLGTVTGGPLTTGYFYDATAKTWSAAAWPGSNVIQPITMTGTKLTVVVGTTTSSGDLTPISFLGISQGLGNSSDFTVGASPSALSVAQGNRATSTITTTVIGTFNNAINLSASGVPSGTTVSFNPATIPAPGGGTSAMTISVGANTATGTYPITVTASGGGIQHTTTVSLTVTATQSGLTVSANPASLTIKQGAQGSSTLTTAISGSFNSQVTLSAIGLPTNTTVSFNPAVIPAPGAGSSNMTVTVGSNTPTGTYPVTVSAKGGGLIATTVVSLTVTPPGGGGGNGITVSDLSGHGQSNRPVSIGRFFKAGDIPQFAQAVIGGTPVLTQCDVKNRWPDGSLKFAIISFVVPNVSTGGTAVTFQNQSTGNNTGYLQMNDMLDSAYDFEAVMRLSGNVNPSISARSMLQSGEFRYWLQGPIVTAVIIEDRDGRNYDVNTDGVNGNPLHPIFETWFYPQGKKVEVGFTLENVWSSSDSSKSARNQTFGLTLTTGNASPVTRLTQPTFTEWAFTRWRRAFWIGSDPLPVQFNWNPQYLVTTGGYPAYDVNYLPSSSVVNAEYATYNNIATNYPARLTIAGLNDPNHGGIVNYDQAIDATGDPPYGSWIGLFPTWDIDYLLTGDSRLQRQMTDNADLAGRFPMWFREADHNAGSGGYFDYPHSGTVDTYGHVVSINARQQVTLALYDWHPGCTGEGADNINAGAPLSYAGWPALDASHLPDFGYVPYTLTGKYYYLEQEEMEAGYVAGFRVGCYAPSNNYYRQGYLGMLELLLRDQAWAMRALAYGASLAPDGDPEGPYFRDKVLNNVARMEGEHGLPLDITDTNDRTTAYQWGYNTALYSQANSPSPLGAWDVDSAAYDYANNGSQNNVNPNTLKAAGSMFQEAFMNVSLGMTRQLGIANTKALLTFAAKRPFHILLDPTVNHYLIGQYCYPSEYKDGSWVADWANFQANYLVLPTKWGSPGTTDDARGFQQMSGVSFMTDVTVDGISGQAVWNWFKANKPNQSEFQTADPRWSITPLH